MAEKERAKPIGAYDSAGNIIIRFPKCRTNIFVQRDLNPRSKWWRNEGFVWQDNKFRTCDQELTQEFGTGKYYVTSGGKFKASGSSSVSEWDNKEDGLVYHPNYSKNDMKPYSTRIIL